MLLFVKSGICDLVSVGIEIDGGSESVTDGGDGRIGDDKGVIVVIEIQVQAVKKQILLRCTLVKQYKKEVPSVLLTEGTVLCFGSLSISVRSYRRYNRSQIQRLCWWNLRRRA